MKYKFINKYIKYIHNIVLLALIVIFVFLSFKKVNSSDTLIPNLEPYPDSLYYSIPAWNLVQGNGFVMKTQNTIIKQQTPPLYGLYLTPFFALFNDPRSFYYANMILLIGVIILFISIVNQVFSGDKIYKGLLSFVLGFFLVTNFYFYTIPQLLMAESITIFLVTLGVFLYVSKPSNIKTFLSGQVAFLLIMVKLSNIPYAAVLSILLFLKFFSQKQSNKNKDFKLFLISSGVGILYLSSYILTSGLLTGHKNLGGTDFSLIHFNKGIIIYLKTLIGNQGIKYLWFTEKYVLSIVVILSISGLIIGLFRSKYRKITLALLSLIMITVVFMSMFVTQDLRYIIAILPAYIIFIGCLIEEVLIKTNRITTIVFMLIIIIISLFLKSQNNQEMAIITFKKQVGLNLRHREVPWNYEAIKVFNQLTKNSDPKTTYIGTLLPPPYVDMFANHKYQTLPISSWQEFYWLEPNLLKKIIGGNDITARYKKLVKDNNTVYITNYYENSVPSQWPKQFNELTSNFIINKVVDGCLSACNIYQLKIK